MKVNRRAAFLASATLLGSAVIGFDPPAPSGLSVAAGDARLSVGAVRLHWSAAFAQSADQFTLDNVTFSFGPDTFRAGRIAFAGVTSTRADLESLFDKSSTESLAARLRRVGARQVTIPELTSERQVGGTTQRSVYRNITLSDVAGGRIGRIVAESSAVETPAKAATLTQGRTIVEDVDASAIARVYTEKAGAESEPMIPLYGSFVVEDIRIADKDAVVTITRGTGRDVRGRPTADSWAGTLSLATALAEMDKPSEQDTARLMSSIADLLGAVDIGSAELAGIEARGTARNGDATARIARVAYGATGTGSHEARVEGLSVIGKDTRAAIETISIAGFSMESALAELRGLKGKPLDRFDAATWRRLAPTLGTLHVSGVDFDVPNEEAKGPAPDRIRFTLKDLELTADKPRNGIPTNIRFAVQNFATAVPAAGQDETLKLLRDLGYKDVNLSVVTAASWNEAGNELVIREVSYAGRDIGTVTLRGVVGNVTADVFNPDTALASVALVGAAAKSADLTIENQGLVDRYLALDARKQKKSVEALRREYGTAAALAVPIMLGNSPQAKALGQAVARFVAKPGRLAISAKAKNPSGLAMSELLTTSEPAALFEKLDVTATSEDRP